MWLWVLCFLALNLQLWNEGSQAEPGVPRAPSGPEIPRWLSCKGAGCSLWNRVCGGELQMCSLQPLVAEKL